MAKHCPSAAARQGRLVAPNWPLAPVPSALLAALLIASSASAQTTSLPPVTVLGRTAPPVADVSGWGEFPLREVPLSATVVGREQLQQSGARRLADLTRFDASVTDAYNAPGYWDFLTVRGFTLDNRFNFRREGLPISAETSIPLDNKDRIEILKGTSGIQAGTSAPGGLVNYAVKRPTAQPLRELRLEASSRASVLAALDISDHIGADQAVGFRLNLATESLKPLTRSLDGQRQLAALATDWRIGADSRLQAEVEWSHKKQPSQAAYSLLGNRLPDPVDPKVNINNQPWSQPSVFDALTGTLRFEQGLGTDWRWSATWGRQSLKTDDRLAYAFGCSADNNFDRYCSDGTYDLYDFRSENERRRQDALALQLKGQWKTGSVRHDLTLGVTHSTVRNRFQLQAFNYVGTGNVQGTLVAPADPSLTDQNTQRDEPSLEWSVQDAIRWNDQFTTWLGLRQTRLNRDSIRTNGSRPTSYSDRLVTPWLAASWQWASARLAYASYGEGVESQVVPNRSAQYTNAGVALPALKSRQFEVGFKAGTDALGVQAALFQIQRPMSNLDACARLGITPCTGANDGEAVHRGLELSGQWAAGPWRANGGWTLIRATRQGSMAEPATNGQRPTNVPGQVLRGLLAWKVPAVPGLELQGQWSHEGRRNVLADGSITLPAWTRTDATLRYETRMAGTATTWTLGIDNLMDKRYWKESPYQFGHVYLYPGAARTIRLAVQAAL
jgi:iron complex outermembrane receptor protein